MSKLDELREQFDTLRGEIETLTGLDDPSEEQIDRLDAAITEAEEVRAAFDAEETRVAKIEEIRSAALDPARVQQPERLAKNDPVIDGDRDPWDMQGLRTQQMLGMSANDLENELRARVLDACEKLPSYVPDETRQAMARHVNYGEREATAKAAHILRYGSPEYSEEFREYLMTGQKGEHVRAAMSTTAANGGALIPPHLDPTVILTNAGTANPFRQVSNIITTLETNIWNGVSSAGVTAEWIAEGSEVTDASPTFAQPAITMYKADAHVEASMEVLQDASTLQGELTRLFQDAKDRLESTAHATGSGSAQPFGIVTALGLTTASRVSASTNGSFGAVDVFALVNSLPARYQDSCVWVAHWFLYNLARQFGGANQPNFWVDLGPGIPSQMLGRSTYQSSAILNAGGSASLSSATASSDDLLILGDFSYFNIVDRMGLEVLYDPVVIGTNRRPTGQVSWTAFWRTGADSVNDDAFRMLRI